MWLGLQKQVMWALKIRIFATCYFLLLFSDYKIFRNLSGFPIHLTEPKYYILVMRYVSSNHTVYYSPHALFSQAWSHIPISDFLKHFAKSYQNVKWNCEKRNLILGLDIFLPLFGTFLFLQDNYIFLKPLSYKV